MNRKRAILALPVAAAGSLALFWQRDEAPPPPRTSAFRTVPAATAAPELGPVVERRVECHAEIPASNDVRVVEATTADDETLIAAVAKLDRPGIGVVELQDFGAELTRLLGERPELGPATVAALERTRERNLAFQIARSLRAVQSASVRERLLAIAADRDAPDVRREAAIVTLEGRGDKDAVQLFAALVTDDEAGELTRTAAAYGLGQEIDLASPASRQAAVSTARALTAKPKTPERLRAEAWDLLGRNGLSPGGAGVGSPGAGSFSIDKPAARAALADSSEAVALAAARALLQSGEPRADIARALRSRSNDPAFAAMVDLLEGKNEGKPLR